jgi:ATP-dependent protease ClpP protease subunit
MTLIQINNKAGKVSLKDVVIAPVMERLIDEMGRIFGAKAAAQGADFGAIMNCTENAVDELEIEIHSPGGSVLDGYTLYHEINKLRARGVYVTATINSLAASMASVIAMAADKIRMVEGGQMMIHEVSKGTQGNAEEHAKAARLLDEMSNDIAKIYANRTGKSPEETREMMRQETWMGAEKALAEKFIDEIFDIRATNPKPKGMSFLSRMFPGNDEAAKIEASILELDNVRASLDAVSQERDALKSEVSGHVETISSHLATIGTLNERISTLETEATASAATITASASKITELESAVTAAQASASTVATEMLASIGQPEPLEIDPGATATENKMTLSAFNQMTPFARMNFVKQGGKLI